jgi:hypothetical protein
VLRRVRNGDTSGLLGDGGQNVWVEGIVLPCFLCLFRLPLKKDLDPILEAGRRYTDIDRSIGKRLSFVWIARLNVSKDPRPMPASTTCRRGCR